MRKFFACCLIILIAGFSAASVCLAVGPDINSLTTEVAEKAGYDPGTSDISLSQSVGQVIKTVLGFVGVVFLALTVYAGFLWMTASGNEENVTKAMGIIKMATIGLIIVVSAYTITAFVVFRVATRPAAAGTAVGSNTGKCDVADSLSKQQDDGWATAGGKAVACAGVEAVVGIGKGLKFVFYDMWASSVTK